MNKTLKALFAGALLAVTVNALAAECEIGMGISPVSEGDNVPASIARKLEAKLKTVLTHAGVAAGDYDCQFFITGRFDHAYSQEASGVGGRVLVNTELQLAICDGDNKKVFASATFPIKGVGATDEQALTRALGSLNAKNPEFINFVENGKAKIIDYFNNNYQNYLSKAQTALKARNYDEALYWSTAIPECCVGYPQASALAMSIYADKVNYEGQMLLSQAQGEWAANPTAAGASAAYQYLAQIDPSAACFAQAQALGSKIAATVKDDHDFETRQKYKDALELEHKKLDNANAREAQRIEAARAAAVAWAKNQPKVIVRNNWIW